MDDWKFGYYKAILNYLNVPDRDIIDLYTVETYVDHSEGYCYSTMTQEDAYTDLRISWKDPVTGRTERNALLGADMIEFLQSI